jgi:hypothetical protein
MWLAYSKVGDWNEKEEFVCGLALFNGIGFVQPQNLLFVGYLSQKRNNNSMATKN